MALSEEAMSFLEEHIPELADVAFKQAYWAALASGSSVLVSENGNLVEVFPDGKHQFIKHLSPATPVTRGQRLEKKSMSKETLRLRMFAGPNGSGKSTFKSIIRPELLGIFINPDEIEKQIRDYDFLDLEGYQVESTENEILDFFINSPLLKTADFLDDTQNLRFNDGKLSFFNVEVNAYFASVAADFIRLKLIERSKSFTFETVMSFPDKIELLRSARLRGYRTYLYYVATEDPAINISRVRYRVKMGGHSVPEDKIVSRYQRSLDLLIEAIQFTNRAYIFDNSTHEHIWLAEITDGHLMEMKTDLVPAWFKKALGGKFNIGSKTK